MNSISESTLERVVDILGSGSSSEDEIEDEVLNLIGDDILARRVLDWVPEAFGALLLGHIDGLTLPTTFSVCSRDSTWRELPFSAEPIFAQALRFAMQLAHGGAGGVFEAVAKRSSLLAAVNNALNTGKSPGQIVLSGPAFVGIPAEVYAVGTLNEGC